MAYFILSEPYKHLHCRNLAATSDRIRDLLPSTYEERIIYLWIYTSRDIEALLDLID